MINQFANKKSQQGAVLVVSLVILTVLTLVGVALMQSSSLEMNAARNHKQFQSAFEGALSRIEFATSTDNANPLNYLIAIPDIDDPSTWPQQTCDVGDGCPDGSNWSASAVMDFTGGCRTMPGFSLESGKAPVMRTFDITVDSQDVTGIAHSVQVQGVRHPAAGC